MNEESRKRNLIIFMNTEVGDNSDLFRKIIQNFASMNLGGALRISNNKLATALGAELPGLSVQKYNDCLINPNDTHIRFMLRAKNTALPDLSVFNNNSHVIEILAGADIDDPDADDLFEFKAVIGSEKELFSIIEDVMLDIQMFYYHGFDQDFVGVMERKRFSLLKVDFCGQCRNNAKIGVRYYSLATLCKNGSTKLDYDEYVSKWQEFADAVRKSQTSRNSAAPKSTDQIVDEIIKKYPHKDQISRRKLLKKVEGLKPGRYIFAYLFSRPHSKKVLRSLRPMFRSRKLRRGSMMIVPYKMRTKYSKYRKYIYITDFTVEQTVEQKE